MKNKINGKMMIGEIIEKYPEIAEVLTVDYGFHCIGCAAANMETLAEGAMVHGMDKTETKDLIKTLNDLVADIEDKS